MQVVFAVIPFIYLAVAIILQGCGSPSTTATTTSTSTSTSTAPPPSPSGWKTNPIEVRGQYLYDSVTGAQWHGKGIGFPNIVSEDAGEWIKILKRIKNLSPNINLVRVYELPACALNSDCLTPFMQCADHLGIYVLLPGTGTEWGYLPTDPTLFKTANECYRIGGVLGWGQSIIQRFNFPNTLGIVIGNEFVQKSNMWPFISVLKAYARDLKSYMNMCNTADDSPTKGQMRQIPLIFAGSDDRGDKGVKPKADYMFCGHRNISVDIFGLNVERWCSDEVGPKEYQDINSWVSKGQYPGAFIFTEMGCSKQPYNGARSWAQVPKFFHNFPMVTGFIAYVYYGNTDFQMFDGPTAEAALNKDGENFFNALNNIGREPEGNPASVSIPTCASSLLGKPIVSIDSVHLYDTGETGWAPQCPQPVNKKYYPEAVISI